MPDPRIEEFRRRAEESFTNAERGPGEVDKAMWRRIGEQWLRLANWLEEGRHPANSDAQTEAAPALSSEQMEAGRNSVTDQEEPAGSDETQSEGAATPKGDE